MFGEGLTMREWVSSSLPQGVAEIADARLWEQGEDLNAKNGCLSSIIELALCCSDASPKERVDMIHALTHLKKIRADYVNCLRKTTAKKYL